MGVPKRLDDILAQVMFQRGYGQELSTLDCAEAWRDIVGDRVAKMTLPTRIRQGVLEVLVENSTIVQELTFQKVHLLACLSERLPEQRIADVRFRIGNTS